MKSRDWFFMNGWRWDGRDHMWKRDSIDNIIESPVRVQNRNQKTNSEPIFLKVKNIMIFNNKQYPLKFHEVMFKP